jgi:cyclopropane fatty-acyl-phospholipid synthase-like methyltransferase
VKKDSVTEKVWPSPMFPKKFDLITAWEVLEHIETIRLPVVFENISNHLVDSGILMGSISYTSDKPDHVELHQTIQPIEWWDEKMRKAFTLLAWPPKVTPARIEHNSIFVLAKKKGARL